ncbi:hypothetical protein SAMN03159496_06042 [Rhizobium sp. NFR07]|jgi:hypothetical protein|nr:hypothetical protein SAMN03159496_06042 [Rhizobium sp. NFR07]
MLNRLSMSAEIELRAGFGCCSFESYSCLVDSFMASDCFTTCAAGANEIEVLCSRPVLGHMRERLERATD